MENRAHALSAGIFVVFFACACVFAIWWFGNRHEAVKYYGLVTKGGVSGLNVESTVRYRGIRAGRVEAIAQDKADPSLIVVTISLDERFKLTQGSHAKLASQGITGLSYIALDDDNSNPEPVSAEAGALPRIPLRAGLFDTLEQKVAQVVTQLSDVSDHLNTVLSDKNAANLTRTLDNVATASDAMKQLPEVMAGLRTALSAENIARLNKILAQVEKVSGEAAPLTIELRETVSSFKRLSNKLDVVLGDTGTASNVLPRANQMMQELTATSRRLSRVLDVVENNPQALVFGRPASKPGPGETGFVAPLEGTR